MEINWEKIKEDDVFNTSLYDKIISISNNIERAKEEQKLFDKAKEFKKSTIVKDTYSSYKAEKQQEKNLSSTIDFGNNAPIPKMIAPGYYKDKQNRIITFDKNLLVTATLVEPIAILKNKETGEELVKCAFFNHNKWNTFIISRETILHNGKITKLANKGVDVTTESARLLVSFLRVLLNYNEIEEHESTSKMGWNKYGSFLPYDDDVEFDGEDSFKMAFDSLHSKGDYSKWLEQVEKDRLDNVPLKLIMAASFASPLLHLLNRQSFVTLLWGKTGGGKTVAGRIAMSIWGDSEKGKLMFSMNNTTNFYYRTAEFFNHLPVFYDELQTYNGNINRLIMSLTEGIDRGKANNEGGTQKTRYWNNTFIFTGEESASDINSGGGTLNRLIEIYITKNVIKNGIQTCDIINDNYGHAGKMFIDFLKNKSKDELKLLFKQKYNELMSYDKTEEKQAINMAMLLTADDLACQCIFKNEEPLGSKDVLEYMFSKSEIDNTERAYNFFLDECAANKSKFNVNTDYGEFWGIKDDYEITIISQKLREILEKKDFSYNKIIKGWAEKGYVEKNSSGKYSTNLSKNGIKANYVIVKIRKEY